MCIRDRAYTTKDVKLLLDTTKTLKFKALIHVLASSGVRAGSIHDMQVKDMKDVGHGCKSLDRIIMILQTIRDELIPKEEP